MTNSTADSPIPRIFAGLLFFITTACFMTGHSVLEIMLKTPNVLEGVAMYPQKIIFGCSFEFANAMGVVLIGIFLYKELAKRNETVAIAYAVSRGIESSLMFLSAGIPLLLIPLSKNIGSVEPKTLDVITETLANAHFLIFQLGMLSLGAGSLMLCWVMFHKRMIPLVLTLLGFVGYVALLFTVYQAVVGAEPNVAFYMPGALFELLFPLWIMIFGFYQVPDDAKAK